MHLDYWSFSHSSISQYYNPRPCGKISQNFNIYRTQVSLGSGLWVPASLSPLIHITPFWNFTDVTLAILADDANRAIWRRWSKFRWWWSRKLTGRYPMLAGSSHEANKLATESARWCRSRMEHWSSYLWSCWQQYGLLSHRRGGDGC